MIWNVVILLSAAVIVESYAVHDINERLAHGRQLKIYMGKNTEKLEFTPADEPGKTFLYWEKGFHRLNKGRVSGTGSDRRWYIDKVTYEDQGTYVQRDYWNKEIANVKVAVIPRRNYLTCLAGESLYISLEGVNMADASLSFSGQSANVTLVRDGARVSQDLPDYWDRVQTHSSNIEIRHVNFTDEGRYTLTDRRDRVVSITKMDLIDHREGVQGNPLIALLLLLGIPAGICCCCRKKIFKKKATNAATLQASPQTIHPPSGGPVGPVGPVGPCPPYNSPGQPNAVYYNGTNPGMGPAVHPPPVTGPGDWNPPPPSGFNPAYPPPNPSYPPAGPAMMPSPQAPQWNGPPQGQYPPGPTAPMGYAPVMYSAPPASSEPMKESAPMENKASSPAEPLLSAAPQGDGASSPAAPDPSNPANTLTDSSGAYQFQIDNGKSSSFL
ncbi:DNA-directed RNA polymerase II subunit RPB1 [Mugil cephalus]|uniref:DNA-directed RNA polymerase II subunit RPB1 n=1 Tax=Mugil cephalus TaxID=48193 RepID=UPI001FB6F578|nr:DNA-directed RNA polymerase II subunit RPB1 [Mugil cephalus]